MSKGTIIQAAALVQRLAMVLDDSCHKLSDVQEAVARYIATGNLNAEQMERLQELDALTQEIEAVRSVLKRMGCSMANLDNLNYSSDSILKDVHLSQVRHILNHGKDLNDKEIHGDVTLF
ncbi:MULTISPECIES: hypothetical protein [Bombella]|uniref:Uncharacterized protein n=1 Tax=Bombella pollinis TaxID=2967337 RepID=A0ABT3WP86_9PROT|nr:MULTISPECIES: hypothetical protein [Bombella]MCX5619935.1 hypothetical protein [Bombella pollinis]MUG05126.1 hypothetical protein [Bombella sp. ESL0378]